MFSVLSSEEVFESKEAIIEVYSALYSDGIYNRDQMLQLSEKLAQRDVDLEEFENQASVGGKLPEPMRTQVLLAKKMMLTEGEMQDASSDFPNNIMEINARILQSMDHQTELIVAALTEKAAASSNDRSFEKIRDWIQKDSLFKDHRSSLQKAITGIQKKKVKNPKVIIEKINLLEAYIQSSIKIQGCDNYIQGAGIRSSILPELSKMRKICEINQKRLK